MYITENLKHYLLKSERFTPSEAFSGITARDFVSSQSIGDCGDDDDDDDFLNILRYVILGDCGMESPH